VYVHALLWLWKKQTRRWDTGKCNVNGGSRCWKGKTWSEFILVLICCLSIGCSGELAWTNENASSTQKLLLPKEPKRKRRAWKSFEMWDLGTTTYVLVLAQKNIIHIQYGTTQYTIFHTRYRIYFMFSQEKFYIWFFFQRSWLFFLFHQNSWQCRFPCLPIMMMIIVWLLSIYTKVRVHTTMQQLQRSVAHWWY